MKTLRISLLFALSAFSWMARAQNKFIPWYGLDEDSTKTRGSWGHDNRSEALYKWEYRDYSRATATAVSSSQINGSTIKCSTLGERLKRKFGNYPLDKGVRFTDQPAPGFCTGYLIAPDILVTAGHCIDDPSKLSETVWIFDFDKSVAYNSGTKSITIPTSNQFRGVEILDRKNDGIGLPDYCFIRLDRKTGRKPYFFRTGGSLSYKAKVAMVGSPYGLPLKVSDSGVVTNSTIGKYFWHDLDAFGGNSGGPVFNADGWIEGHEVFGSPDYYLDETTNTIKQTTIVDSNYLKGGYAYSGNASYRITSTNRDLLNYAIYRNLEVAIEEDNFTNFKDWCVYLWFWTKSFDYRDPILALAIKNNRTNMVDYILDQKDVQINAKDLYGVPMLQLMISMGMTAQAQKMLKTYKTTDIEATNSYGETPLMQACRLGNLEMVKLLLQNAANPNARTPGSDFALAISARYGYTEIVQSLLDNGADPTMKNGEGKTASKIAKAAKNKEIAGILKKAEKKARK
ncbi:MAG: ankyrin repeat domain-containing protein [Bacteroidetes bacterium]|nr:ankyrin repeat domain-containing protein [Bacteroidota bacterium]